MPEIVFSQAPASLPHNSIGQHRKAGLIPVCCVKKAQTLVLLLQCVHCQHVSVPVQSRRPASILLIACLGHTAQQPFLDTILHVMCLVVFLKQKQAVQVMAFVTADVLSVGMHAEASTVQSPPMAQSEDGT